MNFNQINRLFGKTSEDMMICEQKIQSWTKFLDDYKALEERLLTLTDKTRHEIMVPIGGSDLAFMSGYIKHTNEILVLLGDNYFAERSAKQAIDIVDRRIKNCQKMIEDLNKEREQLDKWLQFETQFKNENKSNDLVEIVEEYDEQKERQWREEHQRRLKEHKMSEKLKNKESIDSQMKDKLEKLEIIEENESKKHELKSILKKDIKRQGSAGSDRSVGFDDTKQIDSKNIEIEDKCNEIAFKNQIKERDVNRESNESNIEIKSSPKIVSRFKANRMKK